MTLLGIDLGTTGARALLVDERGATVASATEEMPLATPEPRAAEQDPRDWWTATVRAVRGALAAAGGEPPRGIGLSGQMHGVALLDGAGEAVAPAPLWCDGRADAECREITERVGAERLLDLVGNPALVGFSAPKLLWLRRHRPDAWARARSFLLPKDYLRFRLTGEKVTDVSDASGTLLFDVARRRWSGELLEALELEGSLLPAVVESAEPSGRLSARAAEELGLPAGIPVVGGGGDQAAGAVGAGIVRAGLVSVTIGSSGVVFAQTDRPVRDARLHVFCHAVPGRWHVMGVTLAAGLSLRWLRGILGGDYDELTRLAAAAPAGSEGLLFLPYLMGERTPHFDARARGVWFGLTYRHGREVMARSVLEGVAYSLRDALDLVGGAGPVRALGGGARSAVWRGILADVFEREVEGLAVEEGPAYGAALLAGAGTGVWKSVEEAADACVRTGPRQAPDGARAAVYREGQATYRRLYPTLAGLFSFLLAWLLSAGARAEVDFQPLYEQAGRIALALEQGGSPLPQADRAALKAATRPSDLEKVLDRHALLVVQVNPEQRVTTRRGAAPALLDENGWRTYLVKVSNQAGTTAKLQVESPQAAPIYRMSFPDLAHKPAQDIQMKDVAGRWVALELEEKAPLEPELSGLEIEYRILHVYCADRDLGKKPGRGRRGAFKREAQIGFHVGAGTRDLAQRHATAVLFTCRPSVELTLRLTDEKGRPTVAAVVVRGEGGRIFPGKPKRLAPDFFFHPQVYRKDGQTVKLPVGRYTVEVARGPEYLPKTQTVQVGARGATASFQLQRWFDPASLGWISGDHHVHAAGCVHYETPTQGVTPEDIWLHVVGEDLRIASVLTWGPCYYYQKQFFSGGPHPLSTAENVIRYDVEISGFGSHKAGHVVLLGLKTQDYPGARSLEDWPTMALPILKWARAQGAVVGYAHTGWGLEVKDTRVPSYEMPKFDGVGANEAVVNVTHGVVDFLSAVDTPPAFELSIWYHFLNAGFRTRLAGETDFPCITDDRVGAGRSYAKADRVDFDKWREALRQGRAYVSDGKSHLLDFAVDGVPMGGELRLAASKKVRISARAAALLAETPREEIRKRRQDELPYWDVERARLGASREVPVQLVVNGRAVAERRIVADGALHDVSFDWHLPRSSWIALRVLPSAHTNPVFVEVAGKPIRASRKSLRWLLAAVDACWRSKQAGYRAAERKEAEGAYEHARQVYRRLLAETDVE